MTAKHTPGPWAAHAPWAGFSKITGPNGELIFGLAAGGPEEAQSAEVCDANACLMATAPDLLESLREVKELLRFALLSTTPKIAVDAMEFIRKAEATIAKATGERS